MAWCIINSYHTVVRSIRNTTLKLWANYSKQFKVRNAQNCRKNQSWILHHDNATAHTFMLVREFLVKNKTLIMPQPLYSQDLGPRWLFPLTKTEDTDERKMCYHDWGDKRKNQNLAIKKGAFQNCFEDWKKRWHKFIISIIYRVRHIKFVLVLFREW